MAGMVKDAEPRLLHDLGQPDPEKSVRRTKLGARRRSLVDGELVAQSQVFEGELAVAAEEDGEEPKQVEQQSNHLAEMVAGSGSTDQLLGRRMGFWRWTGRALLQPRAPGRDLCAGARNGANEDEIRGAAHSSSSAVRCSIP
jgi:hypothetical protein